MVTKALVLLTYNEIDGSKSLYPQIPFDLFERVILVDGGSTDGTVEVCNAYAAEYDNIKVYHTKKEGITKAINFGIVKAGDKDVYLTQDDVIHPDLYGRDWLTMLVKGTEKERCGMVGTLQAGGTSGQLYVKDMQWAGTWSLLIPRSTLNRIGHFDENFSPGPGDDIDFSYRVYSANLRLYVADFWIDHHRKTENINDDLQFIKMKNAGYFRKKHNIRPCWIEYVILGERILLDERSTQIRGCFKALTK